MRDEKRCSHSPATRDFGVMQSLFSLRSCYRTNKEKDMCWGFEEVYSFRKSDVSCREPFWVVAPDNCAWSGEVE